MTDLTIIKGSSFSRVLRWESLPLIYKPITAITKAAPVAITSATHGLKAGWRVAVVSAGGMRQINAKNWPLRSADFHKVTVPDPNSVTLNDVNSSEYTAYTSGGYLVSYTPVSLASFTARMQIRSSVDATTTLVSLTSSSGITLDDTGHTITVSIPAADTAAYTWTEGVYDLELASGDVPPIVTKLLSGTIFVVSEVTR